MCSWTHTHRHRQGKSCMDFYTLLDQVIDLLRQRQRVTYRALQRQFQLDEEILNDLKDELLYAHQVARDEGGRVLVWTGSVATSPSPLLPSAQHGPHADVDAGQISQSAPFLAVLPTPDAERRQLTGWLCALVESTRMASQLDPEAYASVKQGRDAS